MNDKYQKLNSVKLEKSDFFSTKEVGLLLFLLFTIGYTLVANPSVTHASAVVGQANTVGLSAGLVGYWPLDGATTNWLTGTTRDLSGNNNTGSLVGMSTTTSPSVGKIGQALRFSPGYVKSSLTSTSFSSSYTISMWASVNCGVGAGGAYLSFYTTNQNILLGCDAGGIFMSHGAAYFYVASPSNNKMHHLTFVWNGTTGNVYVDGVVGSKFGASGTMANPSGGTSLTIGSRAGGSGPIPGTIDDVRIYNRALSAGEVGQLYTLGSANVAHSNNVTLSSGLVGYWPLDGATTNWATGISKDTSGQNNNGSFINMSTTTSPTLGKIGQALNFNGTSSYINLSNPASLNFGSNSFSYSFWFKSSAVNTFPINKATGGVAAGFDFLVGVGGVPGVVEPRVFDGTLALASPTWSGTNDGKWHHVVAIVDRVANTLSMYGDGLFKGSQVLTSFGSVTSSTNLNIGARQGASFYTGGIDDVRIYNRALSVAEIKQLYTLGQANVAHSNNVTLSTGLVGYWPFDGSATNWATGKTNDMSGNGNTGSLISMSTSTSVAIGKVGQALKFDGSSSFISVADSSSLQMGSSNKVTVSVWVKFNSFYTGQCGGNTLAMKGVDSQASMYSLLVLDGSGCGGATPPYNAAFQIRNSGGTLFNNKGTIGLSAGVWYQLTGVYDGSNLYTYVNGKLDSTLPTTGVLGNNINPLTIGKMVNGTFPYWVRGSIDDVRVYNRALSASEVAQLYAGGK